jgi:hypothetical protein
LRTRLIDIRTDLGRLQIARRATSPPHGLIGTLLDAHYDEQTRRGMHLPAGMD